MTISDFCKSAYKACRPNLKSQEKFIDALLTASGGNVCVSGSTKKQFFTNPAKFTFNIKNDIRKKFNLDNLCSFFEQNILDDNLSDVIADFGIPEKGDMKKKALSISLALQFKAIVDSDEIDCDDVLTVNYMQYKSQNTDDIVVRQNSMRPLYSGDKFYLTSENRQVHKVKSYELFEHTWEVVNAGTQIWQGRRLYLSNYSELAPKAESNYIDISDTAPHKSVKITASMDARGMNGKFKCKWIMVDEDGNDCFPGNSSFEFTIETKFEP